MYKQWVEDHFILYVLLLAIIGVMLGILGTYLIGLVVSIIEIAKFMFSAFTLSGGA